MDEKGLGDFTHGDLIISVSVRLVSEPNDSIFGLFLNCLPPRDTVLMDSRGAEPKFYRVIETVLNIKPHGIYEVNVTRQTNIDMIDEWVSKAAILYVIEEETLRLRVPL